jgi:hypothetical protein
MLKNILLVAGILFLLSACAAQHANLDANPAFSSHRYSSHELEIIWKTEKTDTGVRVQGTVRNVRTDLPYNSLELTAKLLDENGKVLAKGNHLFPDRFVGSEPFSIDFPAVQSDRVKRINFTYTYGTVEDHYLKDFESTP